MRQARAIVELEHLAPARRDVAAAIIQLLELRLWDPQVMLCIAIEKAFGH